MLFLLLSLIIALLLNVFLHTCIRIVSSYLLPFTFSHHHIHFSSLPSSVSFLCAPHLLSLCILWWHLFTTQVAGCLQFRSVIRLLPCSEWGHSLGQRGGCTLTTTHMVMRNHTLKHMLELFLVAEGQTHFPWLCRVGILQCMYCMCNRRVRPLTLWALLRSPWRSIRFSGRSSCGRRNQVPGFLFQTQNRRFLWSTAPYHPEGGQIEEEGSKRVKRRKKEEGS